MSCHVCGGPSRFTIVTLHVPRPFVDGWERSGIAHCRVNPAHDTGEPYLGVILARRVAIGEAAWTGDDTWTQQEITRRGDWPNAAKPPERSEA